MVITHIVHRAHSGIGVLVRELILDGIEFSDLEYRVVVLERPTVVLEELLRRDVNVIFVAEIFRSPLQIIQKLFGALSTSHVLHAHSFLPQIFAFIAVLIFPRLQVVRTVHNEYPYFSCRTAASILKTRIERWLIARRHCRKVCCVSAAVAAAIPWVSDGKLTIIENGVPIRRIEELARADVAAPNRTVGAFNFVSVGRLEAQKGFDLLLPAFARAAELCQKNGFRGELRLTVLGDGTLLPMLTALAERLGIADRVQFIGFCSNPYPLMASANCFVLASRHEGFVVSALEAMALKLPTVITNCGGLAGKITNGRDALVVEVGDVGALAEELGRLVIDDQLLAMIGHYGRKFVEHHYDICICRDNYEKVYHASMERTISTPR